MTVLLDIESLKSPRVNQLHRETSANSSMNADRRPSFRSVGQAPSPKPDADPDPDPEPMFVSVLVRVSK